VRVLVVTVPVASAELVADALWVRGARGVEERAVAGGAGGERSVELVTVLGDDLAVVERVARSLPGGPPWRVDDVDPTPATTWRDAAVPVVVADGLVVVPAWWAQDAPDVPAGATTISIEPGAAFGLGDHPTTQLALAEVAGELAGRPGATVADIGCGTGVLAIGAALLGASAVRAVDVSPAAVAATLDNARRNGVADLVDVDGSPAGTLTGPYDVVVANILAPTLVALAADLTRLTAPHGTLVVSGVLAGRHGHVVDALAPWRVVRVTEESGWAALALWHPDRR
jgi:ribosomal protein L11 methyltransferase